MGTRYPRIRVRDSEGWLLFREALCLRFFVPRRHQDVATLVMRSLDGYLATAGHSLRSYVDDELEVQPLNERGWTRVRAGLANNVTASASLVDGGQPDNRGHGFYYRGSWPGPDRAPLELCTMYAWFPTEDLEELSPQQIVDRAVGLLGQLPIRSGNLGLALDQVWNEEALQKIKSYWPRYPGISPVQHFGSHPEFGRGVNDISWLTFLGQPMVGELGGAEGLRARLHSPDTTVTELGGDRLLVRLGERPEAGDLQEGRNLPAYRELARVLEPWLLQSNPDWYWQLFSPEELRRWERRFLD